MHSLTFSDGSIAVGDRWELYVGMEYEIVELPKDYPNREDLGPWKVRTHAYDYLLRDEEGKKVEAWHWHPRGNSRVKEPHAHSWGGLLGHKPHKPTSRVSLEQIIRFCITELGTAPRRSDWESVLVLSDSTFRLYRTWHGTPDESV